MMGNESDFRAQERCAKLTQILHQEITSCGGSIPFWRFMEHALYTPELGYYCTETPKFGSLGDFVTAPEMGILFARTMAKAIAPLVTQLGPHADIVEIGAGSGKFACDVLLALDALQVRFAHYTIIERSVYLQKQQRLLLAERLPSALNDRIRWKESSDHEVWDGVLIANEVIDALPASRFCIHDETIFEQHVMLDSAKNFIFTQQPATQKLVSVVEHICSELKHPLPPHYQSECLPELPIWIQTITKNLAKGVLIFIDYGYPRSEYYHPERCNGTLRAFYKHQLYHDVLQLPGMQDITASVDLTALAEAATGAGFILEGYCTLALFLLEHGIMQCYEQALATTATDTGNALELQAQMKQLLLPTHMGECFQVIGFSRGISAEGFFRESNLSWRL